MFKGENSDVLSYEKYNGRSLEGGTLPNNFHAIAFYSIQAGEKTYARVISFHPAC